jgi:hypothetical protein
MDQLIQASPHLIERRKTLGVFMPWHNSHDANRWAIEIFSAAHPIIGLYHQGINS